MDFPGLVDLQVNGYMGADFSGPEFTKEEAISAFNMYLDDCATAFLPTVVTSSVETYKKNLGIISEVIDSEGLIGEIPGIHLEGPFISPEAGVRGVHNPEWIRMPDTGLLDNMIEWSRGTIKLITIAAENPGAEKLISHAVSNNITVSMGHQLALENDIKNAVSAGAKALTHLGNGITQTINRHNNPIWAGLAEDELFVMIITDSHHLPVTIIKSFIRMKTPSKIIVTSDAAPVAGMPPGNYDYIGENVVLEDNGLLHNAKTGYLAGSSYTMIKCMNYLASLGILSGEELKLAGYYNPLELIDISPEFLTPRKKISFDEIFLNFRME